MPSSRVNAASARSGMLDIPFWCQAILKRVNFNIATLSDRDHARQGVGEYFAETNQGQQQAPHSERLRVVDQGGESVLEIDGRGAAHPRAVP